MVKEKEISWDNSFMEICETIVKRSHCLYVKAAVLIVDPETNNIISIWYNWPARWDVHCDKVWCAKIVDGVMCDHKDLCRWAHAEINAMVKCPMNTKGKIMYSTVSPCNNCAKAIVNSGIKKFVYKNSYEDPNYKKEVLDYMKRLWIEVVKYN